MDISLEDILKRIEAANDYEINEIMEAVRKRFAAAFPDWEVIYLSFPKNDPIQKKRSLDMLRKYLDT